MKTNMKSSLLMVALLLVSYSAKADSIYDNNISALNINMLTDVFMSYTDYSEKMSDLFTHKTMYGTMDRVNEYGDDGSTIKIPKSESSTDAFINNIWINANHVNADMHYGNGISHEGRFNLATVGSATKDIELNRGSISFGGFISYINTKVDVAHANGDAIGLFSKYKYRNMYAKALLTLGSLNNSDDNTKFTNSWVNLGTSAYTTLKIDDTFFVRPNVYLAYTFVTSDDLYVDGNAVRSNNYNFFNVAPALSFIKEISPDWYASLSAKYVAHMGGKNDIDVAGIKTNGLYLDNHTDVGFDLEYDYKQFIFVAKLHKQIGGIDSWTTNINVKYAF